MKRIFLLSTLLFLPFFLFKTSQGLDLGGALKTLKGKLVTLSEKLIVTKKISDEEEQALLDLKQKEGGEKNTQEKNKKQSVIIVKDLLERISQLDNIVMTGVGKMWKYSTFQAKLVIDKQKITVEEALDMLVEGSGSDNVTVQEKAIFVFNSLVDMYGDKNKKILEQAYHVAHSEALKKSSNSYLQDLKKELISLLKGKGYTP